MLFTSYVVVLMVIFFIVYLYGLSYLKANFKLFPSIIKYTQIAVIFYQNAVFAFQARKLALEKADAEA